MVLVDLVVGVALVFEFVNGFHDTANAVATSLATRAISPRGALGLAAVCNFAGALLSTRVAVTMAEGIVKGEYAVPAIILAALLGGLTWNLFTWYLALPISSSHALVGGLAGAALAAAGSPALNWLGLLKILTSLIISPAAGLAGGYLFFTLLRRFLPPGKGSVSLRRAQLVSASLIALSHGSNDAQKMMGILTLALFGAGLLPSLRVPLWIILLCALALTLGTATGGWRIINTMGVRLTQLFPGHGFAAETASFLVISTATWLGVPVSTTQVVSTAIMGVGCCGGVKRVAWSLAWEMGLAWLLTIPMGALLAAGCYLALMV